MILEATPFTLAVCRLPPGSKVPEWAATGRFIP